jgi:hypothetical protein
VRDCGRADGSRVFSPNSFSKYSDEFQREPRATIAVPDREVADFTTDVDKSGAPRKMERREFRPRSADPRFNDSSFRHGPLVDFAFASWFGKPFGRMGAPYLIPAPRARRKRKRGWL